MKNKPDNRENNVDRIQNNINKTIQNMELADELIAKTSDEKTKKEFKDKNDRRERALDGMRDEIKDEAANSKVQENRGQ
jgi:small acid-soluble spore protein (thioredoxin-like protein)